MNLRNWEEIKVSNLVKIIMEDFSELCYQRPGIKEFNAAVVSCENKDGKYRVELSQSAFYPEGGGQPGDRGVLIAGKDRDIQVSDTKKIDGRVIHFTDESIPVGTEVKGILDWERRLDYSQNHTGEHIISGILKAWYGYENVGFHMNDTCVTFDCSGPLDEEQLREVERYANEVIRRDIEVLELFPDAEERKNMDYRSKLNLDVIVRIIEMPGVDTCACCGTHVARTGEIGLIKFLSATNRKKGCRIELVCGRKAYEAFAREMEQVRGISRILSVKPEDVEAGVEKLNADLQTLRYDLHMANIRYLDRVIESADLQDILIHFDKKLEIDDMRYFCNEIIYGGKASVCAIFSGDGDRYDYVISSNSVDLKEYVKELNTALNGRGGGTSAMVQGSYGSCEEEIRGALLKILKAKDPV